MSKKIGIIDVGGGYRGIYAAGVLDYCMEHHIDFDLGIGVSAGSANVISYIAHQYRRNYKYYLEYGLRKEYASFQNFLTKRSYIDLDYVYSTLSNSTGEYPLDFPAVTQNPMDLYIVATDARTGQPVYFDKKDIGQDNYQVLKASCAIPFVCHPYKVNGVPYFDGALSDAVPIEKAFSLGCDKVVLLLTLPVDTKLSPTGDQRLGKLIQRRYPNAAAKLSDRALRYNESIELAMQLEKEGKVLIIAPDDTCGVSTICHDPESMDKLYQKGYKDGARITDFCK